MSIDVHATVQKHMGVSCDCDTEVKCRDRAGEIGFEYANCTESRGNHICDTKMIRYRVDVTLQCSMLS